MTPPAGLQDVSIGSQDAPNVIVEYASMTCPHCAQFDKVVFPGMQGGPLVHIMAAKAVCFLEAMQPSFKQYQEQIVRNAIGQPRIGADIDVQSIRGETEPIQAPTVAADLRKVPR